MKTAVFVGIGRLRPRAARITVSGATAGSDSMSYVAHVLQPGEKILKVGVPHWIGYWRSIACFALAASTMLLHPTG